MGVLTRDDILGAINTKPVKAEIDALGGEVYMRILTGEDREAVSDGASPEAIACMSLVDEAGKRLFSGEDVGQLRKLPLGALAEIVTVALEVNGLDEDAIREAVEDLEETPGEGSTST